MDHELAPPWLIVGGYAVAVGLLVLGGRRKGRPAAAVCHGLAGIVASETSLYWLSAGTDSAVPDLIWFAFPLVISALVAWRAYRLKTWTTRVGGGAPPTFGVLPRRGLAVGIGTPGHDPVARSSSSTTGTGCWGSSTASAAVAARRVSRISRRSRTWSTGCTRWSSCGHPWCRRW